ncbi:MAG: N(4)-(beta-N-acetylglucosaminyl)-L-asparaginase [Chloroflexota bacterium]
MIVIASANGDVGIEAAIDVLKSGGTAIDAVEAGIRLVEENMNDHSVGRNSYPNILGDLELDASIMNGRTLESGAVAAMKNVPAAISVARKVMEMLPHVHLAGDGAERFAVEMGFERDKDMVTEPIMAIRDRHLTGAMSEETFDNLANQVDLWDWVKVATDPEKRYGTVNFIAQDGNGDICCGVSTSGWAWKYPGRVGDSPIIGAGNYADNRYGAAACTGMGEMAIRACTAHSLVFYMKMGASVDEASRRAMEDLRDLGGPYVSRMSLISLGKDGNHAGFTSHEPKASTHHRVGTYVFQTADMAQHEEVPRQYVEIRERWERK